MPTERGLLERVAREMLRATDDRGMLIREERGWSVVDSLPTGETEQWEVAAGPLRYRLRRKRVASVVVARAGSLPALLRALRAMPEPAHVDNTPSVEQLGGPAPSPAGLTAAEVAALEKASADRAAELDPFHRPAVAPDFRLTIVDERTGRRISRALRPQHRFMRSRTVRIWERERGSVETTRWSYDVGAWIRELAATIGVDPARTTLWRGESAVEWGAELGEVVLGDELTQPALRHPRGRMTAARRALGNHFAWAGNVSPAAEDPEGLPPREQAWRRFGIRVDDTGEVHERVLRVTALEGPVSALRSLHRRLAVAGRRAGIGLAFIATGEHGWGVFAVDAQSRPVAELAAGHDLGTALAGAGAAVDRGRGLA